MAAGTGYAGERTAALVGRSGECERLEQMIETAARGDRCLLVVRGDAGVGKSALLDYAEASAPGFTVLRATGAPGDANVPFAGLLELTRPVDHLLDGLAPPQREALAVALARLPSVARLDRFAIGAGLLSLLTLAARDAPILVLVDDLQWIDPASAEAIVFAARRIGRESAAFLLVLRDGERTPADLTGIPELVVRGLDRNATEALASRVRGLPISRELADRLYAITGGIPLAVVEFGDDEAVAKPVGAVPVSRRIEHAFSARIATLPPDTATALTVLAADDSVSRCVLAAALASLGIDDSALDVAERAGLVKQSGARTGFRHPLVRSAVFQRASDSERRRAHKALAEALGDSSSATAEFRRTLHFAAAADGEDRSLARDLGRIGELALGRHAYASAAATFESALGLLPPDEPCARMRLSAARARWGAGDPDQALTHLVAAKSEGSADASLLCEFALLEAEILQRIGAADQRVIELVREARTLADRGCTPALLDAVIDLATSAGLVGVAIAATDDALARHPHRPSRSIAIGLLFAGRFADAEVVFQASIAGSDRSTVEDLIDVAEMTGYLGDFTAAYQGMLAAAAAARETGAPIGAGFAAMLAGDFAFTLGDWLEAERRAEEALLIGRHTAQDLLVVWSAANLAQLAAARGRDADFSRYSGMLETRRGVVRWGPVRDFAAVARGELLFATGDPADAVRVLEQAVDLGMEQMGGTPLTPAFDLIEARVRAGDRRRADQDEERVRKHAHMPWAVAALRRVQGLLATASEGDDLFHEAVAISAGGSAAYEEARTRGVYGEWLRRAGRRVDAREQLRASLTIFEQLGATPWVRRIAQELAAAGGGPRDVSAGGRAAILTPQEYRVAELAATGWSNRDIAGRLFLSTKTVEAHLHRVYRKLNARGRSDLRDMWRERAATSAPGASSRDS